MRLGVRSTPTAAVLRDLPEGVGVPWVAPEGLEVLVAVREAPPEGLRVPEAPGEPVAEAVSQAGEIAD